MCGTNFLRLGVLAGVLMLAQATQAATVIHQYSGGGNPIDQTWRGSNTTNTNVVFESAENSGVQAWKIADPGLEPTGSYTSTSQYYYRTYSAGQITSFLASGWDLSFGMKVPSIAEFAGSDWSRDSNAMVGIYWLDPVTSDARVSFSLQTGRDSSGNTIVSVNGIAGIFTLTPEFHDYRFSYREGSVDFFIDEVYKGTTTGSRVANTSETNILYWGDNNNLKTDNPKGSRVTYYEYVNFSLVPEPSQAWICLMAIGSLVLRRRR